MGDTRNYAALEWVIGEIRDALNDARQALEAYVEDPRDTSRIRFCLTYIHQVLGSLKMIEFQGASLFAEEMERLAQAIMNDSVTSMDEAQEVLMRGLLQLPLYLDHVSRHRDDHPGIMLPLLNDFRAARKKPYLSETNLFSPDLVPLSQVKGTRHPVTEDRAKLKQVLNKLLKMYQYAAASVLRGIKIEENLAYIKKVFVRLENMTQGTACNALWRASIALIDCLIHDEIELSVAVKGLFRQLARELKILEENCPSALNAPVRENLMRNILYYIARSEDTGGFVSEVKKRYSLDEGLFEGTVEGREFDRNMISAPDPDAIRSVVVALQDEINTVKHILGMVISGQGTVSDLDDALPVIKRIADTLAVLGIADLRRQTAEQGEKLEAMANASEIDEEQIGNVASDIVEIEHRLEAIGKSVVKSRDFSNVDERKVEIDEAKDAVLQECRVGLEKFKEAIVEFYSSSWDQGCLDTVPDLITHIRGGLMMVPLKRAAAIIEVCGRYVENEFVNNSGEPDGAGLVKLAYAVEGVDYYLERIVSDQSSDIDRFLELAEESLAELDYPVDGAPVAEAKATQEAPAEVAPEPPVVEESAPSIPEPEPEVAAEPEVVVEPEPAPEPVIEPEPVVLEQAEISEEADDDAPANTVIGDDVFEALAIIGAVDSETNLGEAEYEEIPAEQSSEPASVKPEPAHEDDEIDEEIIEIFIEEAGEVLENLHEYVPRWKDNLCDEESLTIVRRSFHTLKGSGRMVNAEEIGELAWSIENMLNRVIDETIPASQAHVELIEQVMALVPTMIKAFEERIPNPEHATAEKYISWAEQYAQGKVPEILGPEPVPEEEDAAEAEFSPELDGQTPSTAEVVAEAEPVPELVEPINVEASATSDDILDEEIGAFGPDLHAPIEAEDEPNIAIDIEVPASLIVEEPEAEEAVLEEEAEDEDRVLIELFASEAQVHLGAIDGFVREMESVAPIYTMPSDKLQRALHTLKGSAHMANVVPIANLAVPLELFVKELRVYQVKVDDEVLQLLRDSSEYTWKGVEQIQNRQPVELDHLDLLVARIEELKDRLIEPHIKSKEESLPEGQKKVDPQMLSLIMAEEMKLLLDADKIIDRFEEQPDSTDEIQPLMAELQTLEAGAGKANLPEMEKLCAELNSVYQGINEGVIPRDEVMFTALRLGHENLLDMVDGVAAGQNLEAPPAITQEKIDSLLGKIDNAAMELESAAEDIVLGDELAQDEDFVLEQEIPAEDVPELSVDESPVLEMSAEEESELEEIENIVETEADLGDFGTVEFDSAEDLESEIAALPEVEVPEEETPEEPEAPVAEELVAESAEDDVGAVLEIDDSVPFDPADEFTAEDILPADFDLEEDIELDEEGAAEIVSSQGQNDEALAEKTEVTASVPESIAATDDASFMDEEDFDPDILEVFLEEAEELIEELEVAMHGWEADPGNTESLDVMKRALHTLKGGARLTGLKKLGELTHEFETYLISTKDPAADSGFLSLMHNFQDQILVIVNNVKARLAGEPIPEPEMPAPVAQPEPAQDSAPSESGTEEPAPASAENPVIPISKPASSAGDEEFSMPPSPQPAAGAAIEFSHSQKQSSQEVVKISADLLEELVNLAGETSIGRGRLEQQVADFGSSIQEVDSTLRRLQEQLRRLDIETEAQMLFRQEQLAEDEEFDPLEMDRYSQLQQLSRSLTESASDLFDLKNTLGDKVKDTEALLLQQSRVNSSLQEGLMRARMVPFSRMVPRLRRIVRQVSSELGKQVNFELDNVEGEMDRSVLEHMVAPLEHMLRNAVDHGIESPEERLASSKPESGRILLSFAREGGDILLRLADDGRGISLDKVREKAIERGLMSEKADLSDHDIMQFILQAGFSTAENVTQISGRGVGMDVVAAEIKQLGGSMSIESKSGVGTQFTVRLPFTVSVNRALMVQVGHDQYAIPLNTIEGIVRVSPFELEHYYSQPDARFEYAGDSYQVRYLGSVLYDDSLPKLEGQVLPLPVILVRSEQHTMAFQVDNLMGSREIVVKSLGVQFATVQGLSGATVMGDGSVVMILDPHALVRRVVARAGLEAPIAPVQAIEEQSTHKTIMVVDDSVTVRKVTTRFLEREGFNVVTAKDGVDALQVLQDQIPDLMLLDIEMPRMDGFEVAKNIRTSEEWRDIPIIMITSRTGDKHREHALSIGVNNYLGKPYQEEALLECISELLEVQSA